MSKQNNTKNLSALDILEIEVRLDRGSPPSQIACKLGRDPSSIRKEIKNFGTHLTNRGRIRCNLCVNFSECAVILPETIQLSLKTISTIKTGDNTLT